MNIKQDVTESYTFSPFFSQKEIKSTPSFKLKNLPFQFVESYCFLCGPSREKANDGDEKKKKILKVISLLFFLYFK